MAAVVLAPGERRLHIIIVTTSLTVAALIHGLTLPLLSLVLDAQGESRTMIGLSAASQYLAILVVAPFVPLLMSRLGPAWIMFWAVLLSACLFLLLPLFKNVYAWFPLRFLLGITGSLLWVAGEAWVNHSADEHVRGRVVAVYCMAVAAGFALGPLILNVAGIDGWAPFIVAATIMVVAVAPLFAVLRTAPRLKGQPSSGLLRYLWVAPVTMWVYFAFAMTDSVLLTFLPLYGMEAGVAKQTAVVLITMMGLGAIALQWPIGWLADHMNRQLLLTIALVLMVAGSALLPATIPYTPWNAAYMFLYGGVFATLYTVPMVLLGQQFKGADLAAAATVFAIMFNAASIVGPPLSGWAMEVAGPQGMPAVLVLIFACALPLPLLMWWRGR